MCVSPPGSLSVRSLSVAFPARVALSHEKGGRGFLLSPPFDRVAWDQEDTAHTRHTPYTRRIQKEATDQVGEKKPRQAAVVWLPSEELGGGSRTRGKCETKRKSSDSVTYYVLSFLYGTLRPSRSSAGWLSFVLRSKWPMFIQALWKVVTSPFTIESASLSSLQSVGT